MTDDSTLARIVSDRPRAATIELDWPVEYAGHVYTAITVARLTASEVARFQDEIVQLLESGADTKVRLPLFRDEEGAPIPDAVMDALDDDDRLALDKAAANFLPRRFRGLAEQDSGPDIGAPTAASS
jgi:hypothetical protein